MARAVLAVAVAALAGLSGAASSATVRPAITDFSPDHAKPRTEVQIFGSGFTGTTRVAFNGRAASFTVQSDGVLRATVPARATTGPVRVTTDAGSARSPFAFTVTGPVVFPSPTTLRPHARLTLDGRGFQPNEPVRVTLDGALVTTADSDVQGRVTVAFRVPSNLTPQDHLVGMDGVLSNFDALATITIDEPWSEFHSDSANSGYQPYESEITIFNASTLVQAWSANTGGPVVSSPAVVHGVVYVGSEGGTVTALSGANGQKLWTASLGAAVDSSPAVDGGLVYVGTAGGAVDALDAATGGTAWTFDTGNVVSASPSVVGGRVFVNSQDGNLYALDAKTGAKIWASSCNCGGSSPAVMNGVVYTNSRFDVLAFDAATGAFLWNRSIFQMFIVGPAVGKGLVFVGTDTGHVYALNASGLAIQWSHETHPGLTLFFQTIGVPTVAKGVLTIGSDDGSVYAFNASGGTPLWTTALSGSRIRASSAVANGVLFVGSEDGSLYALNAASGVKLWSAATGGAIDSSPAVSAGRVYVGSADGSIYAFKLS